MLTPLSTVGLGRESIALRYGSPSRFGIEPCFFFVEIQPSKLNRQHNRQNSTVKNSTVNTQPSKLKRRNSNVNTQPSKINLQKSTVKTQPSKLNTQPSKQNRDLGRGKKNCIHESMIPEWIDLVIWGHEHECQVGQPGYYLFIFMPFILLLFRRVGGSREGLPLPCHIYHK